ncbi:MAG: polysaccharide deacetylase family protein [Dysgonamonadaceae bacterium]|jgi:peptidoglycan/xylan/chitin deacetylase (PgdA/CDA1 family)|nr:polysaccharide deacetylase family protein [Dysgonamonadaceae bacterium]
MLIEQPPWIYRIFFPGSIWRINPTERAVYLTFDDGPVPEITPWVLDLLDHYGIKATFFCVGDNVRKYPDLYKMIKEKGHAVGNHTFHHLQGIRSLTRNYIADVKQATDYIESPLFRPPHGHLRTVQFFWLKKRYKVIMWDVVTRDYSWRMTAEKVLNVVKKYTRNGSVIVFHDSVKAGDRMKISLPKAIEWLMQQGYTFKLIAETTV